MESTTIRQMSDYLDPGNEELLKDFFDEADQQVTLFEQNILAIETDPANSEAIDEMFRAAHTLKGAAATVQMAELTSFTHTVEDVLDEIRGGGARATDTVIEALLQSIDTIKSMLNLRTTGEVFDEDISQLVSTLRASVGLSSDEADAPATHERDAAVGAVGKDGAEPTRSRPDSGTVKPSESTMSEYELLELIDETEPGMNLFLVEVQFDENNPMNTVGGIQVFAALRSIGTVVASSPILDDLYEDRFFDTVQYYVMSGSDEQTVAKNASIVDVTLAVRITTLKEAGSEEVATSKQDTNSLDAGNTPGESQVSADDSASNHDKVQPEQSEANPTDTKRTDQRAERTATSSGGSILRVDSRRIDTLLNLVSEAVINKAAFNQISQSFTQAQEQFQRSGIDFKGKLKSLFDSAIDLAEGTKNEGDTTSIRDFLYERFGGLFNAFSEFEPLFKETLESFRSTSQNLARITGELQEGVMQIRMVPISQIFSRFPRLVRDVSKSLDKSVQLEIVGEDTELDKSVIEDLLDPLIHCVRNSVDHGIESPAERAKAGKDETGTVTLRAGNEGNLIVIEIEDDGKGIDVKSVYEKAVDREVIHPSKQLSDLEAYNLIFEPGFSTAAKVTDISGRGVGLDVVKKQIEKLNGTVSVWSDPGVGTRITIKLPLTLAILQGLLVRVGEEVYAVPISSVVESHRISPTEIRRIDNYEVMDVREEVVSLLRLAQLFKIEAAANPKHHFVVIVGSEEKKVGLIVDSLIGEEDVVIKPLKDRFTNTPGIAGAAILGNGRVALIIDVSQLLDLGIAIDSENRKRRTQAII